MENHRSLQKRTAGIFIMLMLVLLVLFLIFSGDKMVNEDQILSDIKNEGITRVYINDPLGGKEHEFEIASFKIEKRQTEDRTDEIWCVVEMKNDYYSIEKYIKCFYEFYDEGGWLFEGYNTYQEQKCSVFGYPFGEYDKTLLAYDEYYYEKYKVDLETSEFVVEKRGTISFTYNEKIYDHNHILYRDYVYTLTFDGKEWIGNKELVDEQLVWDIVGEWDLSPKAEREDFYFSLDIKSFDQETLKATGTCEVHYEPWSNVVHYSFDLEEAKIYEKMSYEYGTLFCLIFEYEGTQIKFYTGGETWVVFDYYGSKEIYKQ